MQMYYTEKVNATHAYYFFGFFYVIGNFVSIT